MMGLQKLRKMFFISYKKQFKGAIFKKGGTHLGGNYEEVTKHTNLTQ